MSNKFFFIFAVIFLIGIASAIPQTFNIHGKLTDENGAVVSGNVVMNFTIYNEPTAGSLLWSSGNQTISVDSDGIYNFILTGIDLDFSDDYYLGVSVESDAEMSPRINLTSSPYTFRANVTDFLDATRNYTVDNLNATTDVCITGGNCLSNVGSGSFVPYTGSNANVVLGDYNFSVGTSDFFVNSNGNVGIGTTNPVSKLDVRGGHLSWGSITGDSNTYYLNLYRNGAITGRIGTDNVALSFISGGNGFYFKDSSYASLVTIQNGGKVGIGTTGPSKKLEVSNSTHGLTIDPTVASPTINTTASTNVTITSSGGSVIIRLG